MIIGILSVKNHRYHPNRRLLEAAKALNHEGILVHPGRVLMGVDDGALRIDHRRRALRLDLLLPRLGATIKEYALVMVRHFELLGIPVANSFQSILLARHKFLTLQTLFQNGIPIPETRYASNWPNFEKAVSKLGGFPIVIKTLHSRQGRGVCLVHGTETDKPLFEGLLDRGRGILVQRFIPIEGRRDIRVLVVGRKVIGAMSLIPRKGDFRANIHLHGQTEKISLSREMSHLAVKSARVLGLAIAGVDMIEEESGILRVVDVNYSPGFKGLERCTGRDVAIEIMKHVTNMGRR